MGHNDYELTRILASMECLQARYEQAKQEQDEEAALQVLARLELALARFEGR